MVSKLRGVAWDHRRCWGPLDASIAPYKAQHGVEVTWDRRSLYSFGEGDLAEYAARYDLVIFDHPFVGEAARAGYLLDLAPFVSEAQNAAFAADSVGASWKSYWTNGQLWALPIDAAAQTAAWRPDLLEAIGTSVPDTLDDVLALAEAARARGVWMGFPAKPTDLLCTYISLVASDGEVPGSEAHRFVSPEASAAAMERLRALVAAAHPESRRWNPIACFDHMSSADDLVYAPYAFNYVNYASLPERVLRFGSPPRLAPGGPVHALLGGAGIGVSATAADPEAAFAYAAYLCAPEFQSGTYVREGGQPGSRRAWQDAGCNEVTAGFLRDTLPTLQAAYLRPTVDGFIPLFREGTHRLDAVIFEGAAERDFLEWLNAGYARLAEPAANRAAAT
jgi:multiple sugar transport system substrate-binding protein